MPYKSKVPCGHHGCAELIPPGKKYCEKHLPLHPEVTRSAKKRGYNEKWNKARILFLKSHPLCEECMRKDPPRYTAATVVDHVVPHRGDQTLFWDRRNWQALCKECHDRKTWNEDAHPTYSY